VKNPVLYLLFILLLMGSCRKDNFIEGEREIGQSYFPLDTGFFQEYTVYKIEFDAFQNQSDTKQYILRIEQDTFFTTALNQRAMRYKEMTKENDSAGWNEIRHHYYIKNQFYVENIMENERKMILSFPVQNELIWDLNAYNKLDENLLYYETVHQPLSIGAYSFDSTVIIKSLSRSSFLVEKNYVEVYASNIGLVYREFTNIETQNNRRQGIKEKFELISYGRKI
jgi:hypothetical protein